MYKHPYLQKYKGKSTRYKCPSCGRIQSFTLYLDGNTHEPIHRTVGRCNREIKCGYHYTPKQYFIDNPTSSVETRHGTSKIPNIIKQITSVHSPGIIPFSYLKNSLSFASNFVSFLQNHFTEDQINSIFEKYLLGATKSKEVIFWQIDIAGKIRTGKIMQYNPETGKRIKDQSNIINWAHNELKKSGELPEDFNLKQCFFGEHLLPIQPTATVAIVESEKTACIASSVIPELIWLAAGSLNGLSIEKCQVLKNRNVIFYPDQGAFEKWSKIVAEVCKANKCEISISTLIENISTEISRKKGLDIADFIITELKSKKDELEI